MNEEPIVCGENEAFARLAALALKRFRNDEARGFRRTFTTPYSQHKDKEGQPFKVLRRCTWKDCDLECLPMWWILFPDGTETCAFPEEIINCA